MIDSGARLIGQACYAGNVHQTAPPVGIFDDVSIGVTPLVQLNEKSKYQRIDSCGSHPYEPGRQRVDGIERIDGDGTVRVSGHLRYADVKPDDESLLCVARNIFSPVPDPQKWE